MSLTCIIATPTVGKCLDSVKKAGSKRIQQIHYMPFFFILLGICGVWQENEIRKSKEEKLGYITLVHVSVHRL
jgi:hypothetical protein